jgi:hypothetical protein
MHTNQDAYACVTSLNLSGSPPLSGCNRRALHKVLAGVRQQKKGGEGGNSLFAVSFFQISVRGIYGNLKKIVKFPREQELRRGHWCTGRTVTDLSLTMILRKWWCKCESKRWAVRAVVYSPENAVEPSRKIIYVLIRQLLSQWLCIFTILLKNTHQIASALSLGSPS